MPRALRIRWSAILVQSATIVSSILLAFAVNAWWASRLDTEKEHGYLLALQRDFEIARKRLDDSLDAAEKGQDDSLALFMAMNEGRLEELGRSVFFMMNNALGYEVYSAPGGAYATMVGAGEVELLQSLELKRELADLGGGIEDLRVSERQLLDALDRFQTTELFAQKVGNQDIGYSVLNPDAAMGPVVKARVASWKDDRVLANWLVTMRLRHSTVLEDYQFLSARIDRILDVLATELHRF